MALKLVTAPFMEPLRPDEVRDRLGLGASVPPDTVLDSLIRASRQEFDGKNGCLGRALITQTWDLILDSFPITSTCAIRIPLPPLQSITEVAYADPDTGLEVVVDPVDYQVDDSSEPGWILPVGTAWPTAMTTINAVRVRFVAGYGPAGEDVPEPIRQAIAENVSLLRQFSRSDPALRSETVDGVGSQSWSTGGDYSKAIRESISYKVGQYRIISV